MTTRTAEIYGETAERVASELQPMLVELITLGLQGKQLHWNVKGPLFMSVHEQLDDVVSDARVWADSVAERMITLSVSPSGQADDVARDSTLQTVRGGIIPDREAVALMADRVDRTASLGRRCMNRLGELDLASQELVMEIVRGLEKHLWMLRSQQA